MPAYFIKYIKKKKKKISGRLPAMGRRNFARPANLNQGRRPCLSALIQCLHLSRRRTDAGAGLCPLKDIFQPPSLLFMPISPFSPLLALYPSLLSSPTTSHAHTSLHSLTHFTHPPLHRGITQVQVSDFSLFLSLTTSVECCSSFFLTANSRFEVLEILCWVVLLISGVWDCSIPCMHVGL